MDESWLEAVAASPWLYPIVFLLIVGDAFLVVLPGETTVVALAALSGSVGSPALGALLPIAAAAAVLGDALLFTIGRRVGFERWRWQRTAPVQRAIGRVRGVVATRPAVLIFTARYIPFARIAVNLTAGASGLSYRRFLPLSVAAGISWALYNGAVGLFFGTVLADRPVIAVLAAVIVAIVVGLTIDAVVSRIARRG